MSPDAVEVEVDGRQLRVSNLTKVLYPDAGFTKGDVIDYYARVADVMLPHVIDRPVTFKRFPNGVDGTSFFEKHVPAARARLGPDRDRPARRELEVGARGGHRPTPSSPTARPSIWAANLASLEFHVPQWKAGDGMDLPKPADLMVFDLDPGPGTTVVECCRVAGWLGEEARA